MEADGGKQAAVSDKRRGVQWEYIAYHRRELYLEGATAESNALQSVLRNIVYITSFKLGEKLKLFYIFCIEKNHINNTPKMFRALPRIVVRICRPLPRYFVNEVIHTENLIQNINPDIRVSVPIAVQEHTACGFEDAVHLFNPLFQPRYIMTDAACPTVLETADFPRVSPDNLVVAVAEKRRVKIDKVNALRF
jgi:hypothetical protein